MNLWALQTKHILCFVRIEYEGEFYAELLCLLNFSGRATNSAISKALNSCFREHAIDCGKCIGIRTVSQIRLDIFQELLERWIMLVTQTFFYKLHCTSRTTCGGKKMPQQLHEEFTDYRCNYKGNSTQGTQFSNIWGTLWRNPSSIYTSFSSCWGEIAVKRQNIDSPIRFAGRSQIIFPGTKSSEIGMFLVEQWMASKA